MFLFRFISPLSVPEGLKLDVFSDESTTKKKLFQKKLVGLLGAACVGPFLISEAAR